MQTFESLSVRGQLGRLRRLAEAALAASKIQPARLAPLAHLENTTFRVETSGGDRYVLRIHRATGNPIHPPGARRRCGRKRFGSPPCGARRS